MEDEPNGEEILSTADQASRVMVWLLWVEAAAFALAVLALVSEGIGGFMQFVYTLMGSVLLSSLAFLLSMLLLRSKHLAPARRRSLRRARLAHGLIGAPMVVWLLILMSRLSTP